MVTRLLLQIASAKKNEMMSVANTVFPLPADSPLCHNAINSFKIEACPTCNVAPNGDNMWHYSLTRYISFMDDTAELRHPSIASSVVEDFLGFSVPAIPRCSCMKVVVHEHWLTRGDTDQETYFLVIFLRSLAILAHFR